MVAETEKQTGKGRGRPRKFERNTALKQALGVFYAKGYDGASVDDLTAAMGINRPSLYASFGNKEDLFLQVLDFYFQPAQERMETLLFAEADAQQAFRQLFESHLEQLLKPNPACQQELGGCLLVNSTILACREPRVSEYLRQMHERHQELFQRRLQQAQAAGQLPADCDVLALAQYFNGVLQGMAILARGQQSPEAVRNLAQIALRVWPQATAV